MLTLRNLGARWARLFTARPKSVRQFVRHVPRLEQLERRDVPSLLGNQLFPADNPWNQKITNAPVAANSATLVNSIGAGSAFHPDFGTMYNGAYIGIPFNVVSGTQPKINVIVDGYPLESDLIPVPVPNNAVIEG